MSFIAHSFTSVDFHRKNSIPANYEFGQANYGRTILLLWQNNETSVGVFSQAASFVFSEHSATSAMSHQPSGALKLHDSLGTSFSTCCSPDRQQCADELSLTS